MRKIGEGDRMDTRAKKQTLITFYYIFVFLGLSFIVIDPLIPVLADKMQVGYDRIGIALFFGSISAFITNLVSGGLSDRTSIKKLIIVGLAFLSSGFLMFGIFSYYLVFIFTIILLRAGFGTLDTTMHAFSSKLFKENITQVFLKLEIAWFSGSLISPLFVSAILYFDFPYKYLFFIFSFVYFVFILIFNKICPERKLGDKDNNFFSNDKKRNIFRLRELSALKDPVIIFVSLSLFFYTGAVFGMSSWMTTYFLGFGIKVVYSSLILSVYWLFSIVGMIITTKLVRRFREIIILFTGCSIGTACILIWGFVPNIYIKIVFISLQAMSFACFFPLLTSISASRNTEKSGTVLGFSIAFTFAGSILFQPAYGYIAQYLGKDNIIYLAIGGCVIGLAFTGVLLKLLLKGQTVIQLKK
jgi:fucose permease